MKIEFASHNEIIKPSWVQGVSLSIKREDQIHPLISGNKYRKLKYNLMAAKAQNLNTLLTFGGAYSNHIAATALAGKTYGFKTIGIIRGEELLHKVHENPTLAYAQKCGMQLEFVSRQTYRQKTESSFQEHLKATFGNFYLLPEGGTNALAIKGCKEILHSQDLDFDYICVAVGTGGTFAGILQAADPKQTILAFPALKGDFIEEEIHNLIQGQDNWQLLHNYHFGGYGKIKPELITFINQFSLSTAILLDPIYTGKMLFGIRDLIQQGFFKEHSKILAIHTGGVQGIQGMNMKLQQQGLPLIKEV